MRTVIQAFALGIIISTTILAIVYYINVNDTNGTEDLAQLSEEDAKEKLEEMGYLVVLSTDYNDILHENESLKDEIHSIRDELDHLKNEMDKAESDQQQSSNDESMNNDEETNDEDNSEEIEEDEDQIDEVEENTFQLTISRGMTSIDISQILYENNIIDNADQFNQFLEQNGFSRRIQLGDFEIHSEMDYTEIANVITN